MLHNNMGMCLSKVMKPLPKLPDKNSSNDDGRFRMASMGYNQDDFCPVRKEVHRHFAKAIELDPTYVKPLY